jgi:hypothetical protein
MRYEAVLAEALGTPAYTDARWDVARCDGVFDIPGMDSRACLNPSADATIAFHVEPADTLTLARVFYRRPTAVTGARRLAREYGWRVRHSFHFGHMQTGFAWTTGNIDIDDYLDLWTREIGRAQAIDRAHWDRYFEWLVVTRIAKPEDRREFDRHFTETRRRRATPRPGIQIARCWLIEEAEGLDQEGRLASEIRAAHDTIVELLGR